MSRESKSAAGSRTCAEAQRYLKEKLAGGPKVAVVACEGACVKGEVARIAANLLAYRLERDRSLRICLGEAVTADSGFREAVAGRVRPEPVRDRRHAPRAAREPWTDGRRAHPGDLLRREREGVLVSEAMLPSPGS